MNRTTVPIPWYTAEAFAEIIREIPSTGSSTPSGYAEWLDHISGIEDDLRLVGRIPVRIEIDPVELRQWCQENGKTIDLPAIGEFAASKLAGQSFDRDPRATGVR